MADHACLLAARSTAGAGHRVPLQHITRRAYRAVRAGVTGAWVWAGSLCGVMACHVRASALAGWLAGHDPHQGQGAQLAPLDLVGDVPAVDRLLRVGLFDFGGGFAEPRGAGQSIRRAGSGHRSGLLREFSFQPLRQFQAQQRPAWRHSGQQAEQSHNS